MDPKLPPDRDNNHSGEWVSVARGFERVDRTFSKCDVSSYCSRKDESGLINIDVPESNLNLVLERMKHSVIGRLDFNRVNFEAAKASLLGQWNLSGSHSFVLMAKGFFTVRLYNAEDKMKVRHQGPWFVNTTVNRKMSRQRVSFQNWVPDFTPENQRTSRATVWVRFPGLGLEYWEEDTLMRIGVGLGNPIAVDKKTLDMEVGYYAQILVDIDFVEGVAEQLKVNAGGKAFLQQVIIPFPPDFCKYCKIIGHEHTICRVYEFERNVAAAKAEKKPETRNKMMEMAKKKRWEMNRNKPMVILDKEDEKKSGEDNERYNVVVKDVDKEKQGQEDVLVINDARNILKDKKTREENEKRKMEEETTRKEEEKKSMEEAENKRKELKEVVQQKRLELDQALAAGVQFEQDVGQAQGEEDANRNKREEEFQTPKHLVKKGDKMGVASAPNINNFPFVTIRKKNMIKDKNQKDLANTFVPLENNMDQEDGGEKEHLEKEDSGEGEEEESASMGDWVKQSQIDLELRKKEELRRKQERTKKGSA